MSDILGFKAGTERQKRELPNAIPVLILGIISIVGCLCYGVPGLICGIIALILHKKDKRMYLGDPETYGDSYKNSKAGQICAIIGLSLSALVILILVIIFTMAWANPYSSPYSHYPY